MKFYQEWRDLLFLHWKFPKEIIEKTLPQGLVADTYAGDAYLTAIPFFMPRISISDKMPAMNNFWEVNLRTYVRDKHGAQGIWFYSLDINSLIATIAARYIFHLPYRTARFRVKKYKDVTEYSMFSQWGKKYLHVTYQTKGAKQYYAHTPSLEHFLIERYRLFASSKSTLYQQQVRHHPYPLSQVVLQRCEQNLVQVSALPDAIHFSVGVDVHLLPMYVHYYSGG